MAYDEPPGYCSYSPSLLFDDETIENLKNRPEYPQWVKANRIRIEDNNEVWFHSGDDEIVLALYEYK